MLGDYEEGLEAEVASDAVEWMKNHTIADLRTIAYEIENDGKDTTELWILIGDLTEMVQEITTLDLVRNDAPDAVEALALL
ncbi:MAG: hypothetical protein MUO18_07320 [Methanomassiliicoccales archaeon]|jgi:hypothetical protein|nr:hypothetical protein [Methanomassiliicoccales archaeon]